MVAGHRRFLRRQRAAGLRRPARPPAAGRRAAARSRPSATSRPFPSGPGRACIGLPSPFGRGAGVRASALASESQARPHPSPLPEGEGTYRPRPSRDLPRRRRPAGRSAHGRHAGHGHVHLAAGGHLLDRLHARRPGLLAVLHLHRPVRLLDDHAGLGEQLRALVCLLGGGGLVQLPADRLLVPEAGGRRRRA